MPVILSNDFIRPFDEIEYKNWKNDINKSNEKIIQKLKKVTIGNIDLKKHTDDASYHSDNHSDYSHTDTGGTHSDTHSDSENYDWYEDGEQHRNSSGSTHHDVDNDYYYTTYDADGNEITIPAHGQYSTGGDYYDNYAYADITHYKYSQSGYSQTSKHTDSPGEDYGYSDYAPHDDYSVYNQQHANVDNYIPTAPKFYELEDGMKKLYGNVDIRMYSYDANNFGFGSNSEIVKKVEYKLEIRKVQNIDGKANISQWITLKEYDDSEVYKLNTIDPLKTGNSNVVASNGIYEIKATPRNPTLTISGTPSVAYEFVGESKTITVKIEQNNKPDVVITNSNEFINFTFGDLRVKTSNNSIKNYNELLYTKSPNNNKGVFVSMEITDLDLENYIKGSAKIYDKSNNLIDTEDIIFSNGEKIIKTRGQKQNGYVFFPIEKLLRKSHDAGNVIEITMKDYLDENCTIDTQTVVIQRTISNVNSTILNFNVDNLPPVLEIEPNTNSWTNKAIYVSLSAKDDSGIWKLIKPDGSEILSSISNCLISENGSYEFKAYDNVGNVNSKIINIRNIDKEPPKIDCDLSVLEHGKIQVSDNLSGVKKIQYKLSNSDEYSLDGFMDVNNNTTIKGNIDRPYLHIQAWDNAGNYSLKIFKINFLSISATLNPGLAKQGQRVEFAINTTGYANQVRIDFPVEFKDIDVENVSKYSKVSISEKLQNTETIYYFIPSKIPITINEDGKRVKEKYEFTITAVKADGTEAKTKVYLDVKGSVYDGIRTRMK